MTKTAQKQDSSHRRKKHIEVRECLDGEDQSKRWPGETKLLKLLLDLGEEAGFPTTCGIGAQSTLLIYFTEE